MISPKKRLARVNGNVKAIVDGKEFATNGQKIDGVNMYPATFAGEHTMIPAIIRSREYFDTMTVGEKYNDLQDWFI